MKLNRDIPKHPWMDLSGDRFGRLTVLRRDWSKKRTHFACLCDCGCMTSVSSLALRSGKTRSCGCLQAERAARRATKHGRCGTPLYNVLNTAHRRCENPNCYDYKWYGARGISVCEEWSMSNFLAFEKWAIENGYQPGLTLDRIDVNGNYEPSNCRWITIQEQQKNRRKPSPDTYPRRRAK